MIIRKEKGTCKLWFGANGVGYVEINTPYGSERLFAKDVPEDVLERLRTPAEKTNGRTFHNSVEIESVWSVSFCESTEEIQTKVMERK